MNVLSQTNDSRLQVHEHRSRHMFPAAGLGEESVERVIATPQRFVTGHLSIGLYSVLEAVQLPTRVPNLHSGLPDMHADHFALKRVVHALQQPNWSMRS
jgi:hypothetical protein